jgi:hypothetical protein
VFIAGRIAISDPQESACCAGVVKSGSSLTLGRGRNPHRLLSANETLCYSLRRRAPDQLSRQAALGKSYSER